MARDEREGGGGEEALADRWAEILAGLPTVEPEHFEPLARKALALAPATLRRFPDLLAAVEDRLDEIWAEFYGRRGAAG